MRRGEAKPPSTNEAAATSFTAGQQYTRSRSWLTSLPASESWSLSSGGGVSGLGIGGIQSLGASGIGMSGAAMNFRSRIRFLWSSI